MGRVVWIRVGLRLCIMLVTCGTNDVSVVLWVVCLVGSTDMNPCCVLL